MNRDGNSHVVIVGGGIGGITTALGLKKLGVDFVVLEQAEALQEVGAGLQLSPNAVHILHWLGLAEPLAEIAVAPEGLDVRSYRSGEQILWTPLGQAARAQFGAPYYHAHRADLLAILVDALDTDRVRLNTRCVEVGESDSVVTVKLADGSIETGAVLIAADGVHSMVRAQLFGDKAARRSSTAWRGLIDAETVAELEIAQVSGTWWGPGRSFVHYFVSGGRKLNWVGIVPADESSIESWSATGTAAQALAAFDGWHPQVLGIIAAAEKVFHSAVYDRDPLSDWVVGRIALLGDAAHAMLPHHAQGAAQSIEDAHVLVRTIEQSRADLPAALQRYQSIRRERANWLQEYSRNADRHFQLTEPADQQRRDDALRRRQKEFVNGFPPGQMRIYGYNAVAEMNDDAA